MAVTKPVAFDHVQIKVVCYTPTQICVNVLDYVVESPVITFGATLQEIATALSAAWNPDFKAFMPSVARFRGVSAQDLSNPISIPYVATANDGPGTNTASLAPTQTAALIRKKTLSGGRANRGRIYIGFAANADVTATGGMTVAAQGRLIDIKDSIDTAQTIVGAGGTTTLHMVVWHKGGAFDYTRVEDLEAVQSWATQRRRGAFGRTNVVPF